MGPHICGPSVWNLLRVCLLAPSILRWLQDFWKICAPLVYTDSGPSALHERKNRKCSALSVRHRFGTECRWNDNTLWTVGSCHVRTWGTLPGSYYGPQAVPRFRRYPEKVSNCPVCRKEYSTHPLLQVAGRNFHISRFLPSGRNPRIDTQPHFFLRKRVRGLLD
jgi:hypothetical protein